MSGHFTELEEALRSAFKWVLGDNGESLETKDPQDKSITDT